MTTTLTPSLVVFGPQITTLPSREFLDKLRDTLIYDPRLVKFREAIRDLPNCIGKLIGFDPRFALVAGLQSAHILRNWIDDGELLVTFETPVNSLFTPLTIIIQAVLYSRYAYEQETAAVDLDLDVLETKSSRNHFKPTDVQGFCTGFLTAAALALAKDGEEFSAFASVALRLAFCVGATLELDVLDSSEETTCLAVRWRSEIGKSGLDEVLRAYPKVFHLSTLRDVSLIYFRHIFQLSPNPAASP